MLAPGRGEAGRGEPRKGREKRERTVPRKRIVIELIASPGFPVLQTVQAIITFLPHNSLRARGYSCAATGETEPWRGGG